MNGAFKGILPAFRILALLAGVALAGWVLTCITQDKAPEQPQSFEFEGDAGVTG